MGQRLHRAPADTSLQQRKCHALAIAVGQALLVVTALAALPTVAQTQIVRGTYAIAAGPLEVVLVRFGQEAGVMISYSAASITGRHSPGVSGNRTVSEALLSILQGTGLEAVAQPNGGYAIRLAAPVQTPIAVDTNNTLAVVTVTAQAISSDLPKPYAGGQVARGARLGILGNADYMDAPFSVKSFTREFLDNQQAQTVSDAIRYDASVQSAQASPNGINDVFYIRGFQTHAGRASFDGLPNLLNRMLPLDVVERVELFKGPSSFLNGRTDAVGGTVNLVPKRAGEKPLNQITASYESASVLGVHADLSRRFGKDNAWGLRVNAAKEDGETSVRPSSRDTTSAAVALDYRGDAVRFSLDYIHQQRRQQPSTGESVILNNNVPVPAAPDAARAFGQRWTSYDREFNLLVARADWDIAPDLTATLSYGHSDDKESQFSPISRVTNATGNITNQSFDYTLAPIVQDSAQALLTKRFRTGGLAHTLTAGFNATRYDQRNDRRTLTNVYASNLYAPVFYDAPVVPAGFNRSERTRVFNNAVFIGDQISAFDDKLLLTLGLRHVKLKTDTRNLMTGIQTAAYEKGKITPAFGLLIKASPQWSFYGNYVEALEQGGTAPATVSNAGETLPPLMSKQFEVGVKADFGVVGATLGAFHIQQPAEITRNGALVQEGKQVNQGLELSVFGSPLKSVRLLGGLTLINARNRITGDALLDGKTSIGVPRVTATANVEFSPAGKSELYRNNSDCKSLSPLKFPHSALKVGATQPPAKRSMSVPELCRADQRAVPAKSRGPPVPAATRDKARHSSFACFGAAKRDIGLISPRQIFSRSAH
ncbi:TonB-dependent receptor [Ottowia thiooxydans]|uniref:TonB-dependent receptor n=1 Tax=Ottowia thiooxydans TaxID=219182 RepID=UPI0004207528|nr:TonB-dependent receptor [Ottowia thiooxydans]